VILSAKRYTYQHTEEKHHLTEAPTGIVIELIFNYKSVGHIPLITL